MKTVLITGASRGIGAQMASSFAQRGYAVAVNYNKSSAEAHRLCDSLCADGFSATPFYANVQSEAEVAAMLEGITRTLGGVDILINNAGISQISLFTDITLAQWDDMLNTNVRGAFLVSRAVLPHMLHNKWGRIINISSMWGQIGASCEVHYSAAKAALIGFTKALAKEEAPSGITVNCIAPGAVDTDMLAGFSKEELCDIRADIPLGRLGATSDIANAALFFASDMAAFITGQVLGINGGQVI